MTKSSVRDLILRLVWLSTHISVTMRVGWSSKAKKIWSRPFCIDVFASRFWPDCTLRAPPFASYVRKQNTTASKLQIKEKEKRSMSPLRNEIRDSLEPRSRSNSPAPPPPRIPDTERPRMTGVPPPLPTTPSPRDKIPRASLYLLLVSFISRILFLY